MPEKRPRPGESLSFDWNLPPVEKKPLPPTKPNAPPSSVPAPSSQAPVKAPAARAPTSQASGQPSTSGPPASGAPALSAPTSEATASEAFALEAPASQAPASEAPASETPPSRAPTSAEPETLRQPSVLLAPPIPPPSSPLVTSARAEPHETAASPILPPPRGLEDITRPTIKAPLAPPPRGEAPVTRSEDVVGPTVAPLVAPSRADASRPEAAFSQAEAAAPPQGGDRSASSEAVARPTVVAPLVQPAPVARPINDPNSAGSVVASSAIPPSRPSVSPAAGAPPVAQPWVPPPLPARPAPAANPEPRILSVAQLGRVVGRTLERTFVSELWVEGEVTGARAAQSGHVYFCMKDEKEDAAIDVVLYRSQVTPRGRALIKDGARVRVRGKPTYWSPRGKLQFVGDRVEPTGKGALLEALEKLKEKLQAEGLFAQDKKRPLPQDPRVIGVVTSAQGAVIHDICKVAFRRGGARILLAPALVQGAGAAESIRRALRLLQKVDAVDVIVVGRGGGSQDDLLAFNDEQLVRDVAACRVPVVSAVGHEVDVTLVDFAADARAATPSQAAEMIVPDSAARQRLLEDRSTRLRRAMQARITEHRVETGRLAQAFGDPRLLIASAQQRVDEHVMRLGRILSKRLEREKDAVSRLGARLGAAHPRERIARDRARAAELEARLGTIARAELRDRGDHIRVLANRLDGLAPQLVRSRADSARTVVARLDAIGPKLVRERADRISSLAGRLDAMSPLKVLARGYAIVTRTDGHAVRDAGEVHAGDTVRVRVASGAFEAQVTDVGSPPGRGPTASTDDESSDDEGTKEDA